MSKADKIFVEMCKDIIENGWSILVLKPLEMSLEDIFLELTKDKTKKGGKKK